ncbi:Pro-Pol protein [Phytophthora palmivora]|uniref:Pro-Pol protein n=1 Tax=Phytophthora palmivora TaxID=4796 RepID=A0A2P4X9Y6_9STRA|nr:Pro-Pol protein [Phytophthora palmivora]
MTAAHQDDRHTKRMNRTLEEYLRSYVGPFQDDWALHLANTEFAINSMFQNVPKSRRGANFHERQAAMLFRCRETLA